MKLKGSCHCGAVSFTLNSNTPYPYQRCYCSICRKTQGGGGYAVNLGGDFHSLKIKGADDVSVYHARLKRKGEKRIHTSTGQRHFCRRCGSALWLYDPTWPDLVHPFASAIDTPLPTPPDYTHLLLDYKAPWVEVEVKAGRKDKQFAQFPKESLLEWHQRHGFAEADD
ncbi:GFA family protein [Herbaspirillum lusitanum]|uniref:GFA family protein n=1 Tax=Herbaspirillum lusitanum TaxID=213312 RepID=UPI0002FC666C|nr:GFA family protein [Herbaspirillum lusitanum]MCW5298924.1 GFA family protein [Herbaspirillum lusitanum]